MGTGSAELARPSGTTASRGEPQPRPLPTTMLLHPALCNFVRYCAELRYGEIERLTIQDGLPVLAELTTKKVKFT